ncbi:MAG TPA: hypothetical protein VLA15_11425, partial [Desulfurivibrionaceae bacterium]|nr:hypothetical protein [Desulfurivibrionaceae bacterium]
MPASRRLLPTLAALSLLAATAPPGAAQEAELPANLGFGFKAGLGIEPTQVVVGLQYALGTRVGAFRLVPNMHLGLGDGWTVFDFNADFLIRLVAEDANFAFYGGGAPTLSFWDGEAMLGATAVVGTQIPLFEG